MIKEREFLKKLRYASLLENDLRKELEELLAQPEREPSVKLPDSEDEAVMMNLLSDNWLRHHAPHRLNQPKQEPVAWMYEWEEIGGKEWTSVKNGKYPPIVEEEYCMRNLRPLYTSLPKREPLGEEESYREAKRLYEAEDGLWYGDGFVDGLKFAEKMHGIGGGE